MPLILKLLGAVMVVVAFSVLGGVGAASLRERTITLRRAQAALEVLETEIGYLQTPLPSALTRVGKVTGGKVGCFFSAAGRLLGESGFPADTSWREAFQELAATAPLTAEDSEILLALGNILGLSDRPDQSRHLRLARERLKAREAEALEDEARNSRLYRYLGVLAGLALVLLLL